MPIPLLEKCASFVEKNLSIKSLGMIAYPAYTTGNFGRLYAKAMPAGKPSSHIASVYTTSVDIIGGPIRTFLKGKRNRACLRKLHC